MRKLANGQRGIKWAERPDRLCSKFFLSVYGFHGVIQAVVKSHPKLKKVAHFFNSFPFSPFGDIDDKSWIEYTKKVPVKESFKTFLPNWSSFEMAWHCSFASRDACSTRFIFSQTSNKREKRQNQGHLNDNSKGNTFVTLSSVFHRAREVAHFQKVLQHPAYQANPLAAISEHIKTAIQRENENQT